ncbi:hypothetical protein KDH83_07060 [Achromobacter sp. Marseille-Q0513]|uniref:hypothetical protein n=1 Tax=unclassified Achromobacter TaxID=2626865 RepID=UPI00131A3AED|nr:MULTISPECIES: hypothetical protein [unclassified Achromobacter]MBR8653070.1 hypothetical protein [Achromobacter sp. Marseille-Q0513]
MDEKRKEDWQSWVELAFLSHGLAVPPDAQRAVARTLMRLSAVAAEIAPREDGHD